MKKLIIALGIALGLVLPMTGTALIIDAQLTSFQHSDVSLNGGATAGGVGTFQMLSDVTGTDADFLGGTFLAACLEPNEFVSVGNSYQFEFVNLRDAPTSVAGGMGFEREQVVERVMGGLGWESISGVVAAGAVNVSALGMVLYEAAFETEAPFDWSAGSAVVTGSGAALSATVASHAASTDTPTIEAFGLLNTAPIPATATRSVYTGQDFVVMRVAEDVAAPGAGLLMMLGLGMLGMTRAVRTL